MARLLTLCALVATVTLACRCTQLAFTQGVGAPARANIVRATDAAPVAAVATVSLPSAAHAFVYNGVEYFDVFFGIDPAWWAFLIFCVVYCGAVLKNAVEKYNQPRAGNPELLKPPKMGKFVGKEVETNYGEI